MSWSFDGNGAVFFQIAKKIRTDIVSGIYKPDEQLPSVRQLAFEAAVNPNTMQKALTVLENEGLLYCKGTAGRFITPDVQIIENARYNMKIDLVKKLISEAASLGIGTSELIEYIDQLKQEENV